MRRWAVRYRMLILAGAAAVAVELLVAVPPAQALAPAKAAPPVPPRMKSVPVTPVTARAAQPDKAAAAAWTAAPAVSWPVAVSTVSLPATKPGSGGDWVRAGALPVWLALPAATGPAPARSASVEVLDRAATARAGVDGLVVRVSADTAGPVKVRVDYGGFRRAYGGDWGRRLSLVSLPGCALSTPQAPECTTTKALAGARNDTARTELSGEVDLAGSGGVSVFAAMAGASSDSGDYAATSLSASAAWSAGGPTGDFTWSYPLRMPPAEGDVEPEFTLGYSAQSVDGRVASTNNQPSWVGEGFDLANSYVERKYGSCADDGHPGKGDLCWKYDNAAVVLNGKATELVRDDATGRWRLRDDDGSRVEKLTNAAANGDNDKEYWRLTTTDGTQYFFGLHQLPGWTSGKPFTNSVWTAPVAGDDAGEPCNSTSGFAASFCTQAWRWNLDYVVDPHGNAASYWYTAETNYYAKNGVASPGTVYTRGGYLNRIDYGQRSDTLFTASAAAQVAFGTDKRCIVTANQTCASVTPSAYPDSPVDQICDAGSACTGKLSPTFFSLKRLTTVTTKVWTGAAYKDVDSWALTQSFPDPGDGGSPALWLSSISHTGKVGGSASLPAVTFAGAQLTNRVDALEGIAPMVKWRVRTVTSETGGVVTVDYAPTECRRATLPSPASNTKRCFPVYWTPPGQTDPQLDWFHM